MKNPFLSRNRSLTEDVGKPLLLTFEPAGDGESDIAWVIKGKARDLGRYALCPHIEDAVDLLNKSLIVNDGIGMGGEEALRGLNEDMIETRYRLGKCVVEQFVPIIEGIVEHQTLRARAQE